MTHTPAFAQKRRDILAGAARVFERRGFAAGTTKEIAAEVGLSQPAIYHYVGAKEDLLREIALQVADDMTSALSAGLAKGQTARDQFRGVIIEFSAAVIRNQHEFAVFWKELHAFPPELRAKVERGERAFLARVAELVRELQKTGELPSDAPTPVVAEAILGMVCWSYHWYRKGKSPSAEATANVFCELVGLT